MLTIQRDLRSQVAPESNTQRPRPEKRAATRTQAEDLAALLAQKPLQGCKVLVAEDADVIRGLFESVLGTAGATVASAKNGQECLDLWKSEQPDLVLLDIKMPVMDGWTAIRRIRAEDEHLPVIAVTASVLGEELQKSYQAGFTEVVSKPVIWTSLVRLMMKLKKQ